jgi:hypothetical protein
MRTVDEQIKYEQRKIEFLVAHGYSRFEAIKEVEKR